MTVPADNSESPLPDLMVTFFLCLHFTEKKNSLSYVSFSYKGANPIYEGSTIMTQ